nr:YbaY family lipoprotein [Blastocatellia bacterium]
MKNKLIMVAAFMMLAASTGAAQTLWLDRPLTTNWNSTNGVVPQPPKVAPGSAPETPACRETVRTPVSLGERALTRVGWFLFGPSLNYGSISIVTAMASVDGMCRPNQYNGFVFINNRYAGMLAPTHSTARSDGSMGKINLYTPKDLNVEFLRYGPDDALCCPSQTSLVSYEFTTGATAVVRAADVSTAATCRDQVETQDNVISGTVTYRPRMALPSSATLVVRLVDVSRQDVSAPVIAEQRIETGGAQIPFSFDLTYDRSRIQERNRYAIRAEILDGGRLLYTTDVVRPVLTQGNPRVVDLELVRVGTGTGTGPGIPSGRVIRGTVTYLQRIALGPNSQISVRLVDSANPQGDAIAEETIIVTNRQVPISFELNYNPRDIDRQRNYELWAEIRTDGQLRFQSEQGQAVNLRGAAAPSNVELRVAPASDEPEAITGQTLSLSKFGTGSLRIGDRGNELIVRGNVVVRADGSAEVTVN